MSSQFLIQAKDVGLSFVNLKPDERNILSNPMRMLAELYFKKSKRKKTEILRNITFDLRKGERLGIIGINGAGKSTLIRLLAGIYPVTTGSLVVNGQTTGMFDITAGTSQQATGLENVYLRGLQMGLSLKEIKSKIPEILEFTELGEDIHKSFDTYSSGMKLRLAFSISTMIRPEILLMDEWLGAGDARFKGRVKERMDSLVNSSSGLIITSHNTGLLKNLCEKGLVLDAGNQVFLGNLDDAIEFYKDRIAVSNNNL